MIRHYELGMVINPDLSDEQLEAQIVRVGQVIETRGGTIAHLDRWGRRRMAYPINRHRDGYYVFYDMELDSTVVGEVDRFLLVQENLLRYLLTMVDPRALAERQRRRDLEAARIATAQANAAQRAADQAAQAQAAAEAQANAAAAPVAVAPVEIAAPVAVAPVEIAAPAAVAPVEIAAPAAVAPVEIAAPAEAAPVEIAAPANAAAPVDEAADEAEATAPADEATPVE
jgi:small subunit ribosomal protein S6